MILEDPKDIAEYVFWDNEELREPLAAEDLIARGIGIRDKQIINACHALAAKTNEESDKHAVDKNLTGIVFSDGKAAALMAFAEHLEVFTLTPTAHRSKEEEWCYLRVIPKEMSDVQKSVFQEHGQIYHMTKTNDALAWHHIRADANMSIQENPDDFPVNFVLSKDDVTKALEALTAVGLLTRWQRVLRRVV